MEETGHGPGQCQLRALDELTMQGLATNLQFGPINRDAVQPGPAPRILQLIPELIARIIE
jgi:hypothetical protein